FHGSANGISGTTANPAWYAVGESANGYFGTVVAGAGDVNNDGYADIVIGSGVLHKVWAFYGSSNGITGTRDTPDWSASTAGSDAFGLRAASVGDLNNDGYADLGVSAWSYQIQTGKAYVFRGSANGLTGDSTAPAWSNVGENKYDGYGYSITSAGDVNGDGFADLLIGAFGVNDQTGKAYVYHSAPGLIVHKRGGGTVTSVPAGIDCDDSCFADFSSSVVTLTATADSGYQFQQWSGDCTGTGSCIVTLETRKVVTATFDKIAVAQVFTTTQGTQGILEVEGAVFSSIATSAAPTRLPRGVRMPLGTLAFTLNEVTPGATVPLRLYVDSGARISGYYKQHRETGAWVNLATQVSAFDSTTTQIDFSLTDGGPFDTDGAANGVIVDPGGAVEQWLTPLIRENTTIVAQLEPLTDTVISGTPTYAISGGPDAARFAVDATSGLLRFQTTPDYEQPDTVNTDSLGRPVYTVTVTIDGAVSGTQQQTIVVSLLDDPETDGVIQHLAGDYTAYTPGGTAEYVDADPAGDLTTLATVGDGGKASFASGALT
ncbi:MAG: FG-GAP repeat protein, partial [Caldilineaceae bacterium]|nr:FG-GAP repeat protein [Caldilineaceae bacterium]